MESYNLVSFGGIFLIMAFAWLFSSNRNALNWRAIIWGMSLQMIIAAFVFLLPGSSKVFLFLNDLVIKVLESASYGTRFLFGRLALPPGTTNGAGESSLGFFFAFQALPAIIFFASLVSALYYLNVMPPLIKSFAYIFTRVMRISGAESFCVASNIFVGIESALTIRPHLNEMTRSELGTILTAGMATIASSVLALYAMLLHHQFPTIAGHLISASVLSAPAALVMSKIIMPELETPKTLGIVIKPHYEKDRNLIEAIITGAHAGVRLVVGISALLLAFLGMVALIDLFLVGIGEEINLWFGWHLKCSLRDLLGYLFYPFTMIIGVPFSDAATIAKIIGERIITTEIQSYQDLALVLSTHGLQHPRSAIIAVYALCGFAHVASLAIFVGGIAALAPKRIHDLSRLGPRALLAATLACLMTASVAGTFFNRGSILLGG